MATKREIDTAGLGERISALPGFARAQAAAARVDAPVYVVGGAVRDALLGRATANLDLVIEGDQMPLIEALDGAAVIHDRFETATVETGDAELDIARARTESYPYPGALPEVEPADLGRDLERRDFTVNAIAVAVADPGLPIDPLGGLNDLAAGALRVMHDGSFADDPTRALRAARYAARLGFEPEPRTLELLRATDFATVSPDRVATELGKLAGEDDPRAGFELLDRWGLVALGAGAGPLIDAAIRVLERPAWDGVATRAATVLAAARGSRPVADALAEVEPGSPSAAVAAARGRDGVDLVLARSRGAEWLDDYVERWREVELEISGDDLIAAGVAEGPAVGRGLAAALRAKLDGEVRGRDEELRAALDAAAS